MRLGRFSRAFGQNFRAEESVRDELQDDLAIAAPLLLATGRPDVLAVLAGDHITR